MFPTSAPWQTTHKILMSISTMDSSKQLLVYLGVFQISGKLSDVIILISYNTLSVLTWLFTLNQLKSEYNDCSCARVCFFSFPGSCLYVYVPFASALALDSLPRSLSFVFFVFPFWHTLTFTPCSPPYRPSFCLNKWPKIKRWLVLCLPLPCCL